MKIRKHNSKKRRKEGDMKKKFDINLAISIARLIVAIIDLII